MKKSINISQAWHYGWQAMRENFIFVMLAQVIIYGSVALVGGIVAYFVLGVDFSNQELLKLLSIPKAVAFALLIPVLSAWAFLNWTAIILKIRDGKKTRYNDIKLFPPRLLQFLGWWVLLILSVGLVIVLIGGTSLLFDVNQLKVGLPPWVFAVLLILGILAFVYLCIRISFITYYFVDTNLGIITTIKNSFALTRGVVPRLILFFLLVIIAIGIPVALVKALLMAGCKSLETPQNMFMCFESGETVFSFAQWVFGVLVGFMYVDIYRQLKPRRG